MNNRNSMSLLGIPAGDIRAFKREGGRIRVFKDGGTQPTSQTVTQTTVPEYLRPQVESMVGKAAGLMEGELDRGFQPFQGQRVAGFSPMQAQAFENVAGQQVAPQLADASNMAYGSGSAALGFGARGSEIGQEAMRVGSGQSQQAFGGAQQYGGLGSGFGIMGAAGAQQAAGSAAGQAQNFGSQAAGVGSQYARMATDPNQMQSYMSPYMQNVVDVQQQEAMRQADIQRQANQAQAVSQGAFGGSRQGVVEAEAQRNLATQLGRIQAEGSQRAFEQAQQSQQFGAGLGLQGLQAGLQGVGQQISAGQLGLSGARTGIEGAQTGLQGVGQQISAGQLGQQAAGTALQGAGLGISGAQAATGAAGQLGQLGGQQFEQQMGITDAMQKYGALQQAQQQAGLDVDYQNYLAAQNHPFSVIGLTSDIIRGHQASDTSKSVYGGEPSAAAQIPGAIAAMYAGSKMKAGGQVKRYQDGGGVSADAAQSMDAMELPSQLRRLSDSQLAAYARTVKDAITLSAIQSELSRRAKARQPASQAPQGTTAEGIAQQAESMGMYGGGIVALQGGGQPMPAFTGGDEYGVTPEMMTQGQPTMVDRALTQATDAVTQSINQGPYSGMQAGGRGAPVALPPVEVVAEGGLEDDMAASPGIVAAGEQRRQNQAPAQTGGTPSLANMSFDQWRQASSQYAQSPEDAAILADMKARVDARKERADDRSDKSVYEAILMGGLAMMSGTSFADGLAKAAQTGGATFMASKQNAAKAIDAAEDAELAFNQYKMSVRKGDEKAAQSAFENYMGYTAKMAQIGASRELALAKGQLKPLTPQQVISIRSDIARVVADEFKDVMPSSDPIVSEQQKQDRRTRQRALEAEAGLPPLQVQSGSGGGAGNRPALSSFIN